MPIRSAYSDNIRAEVARRGKSTAEMATAINVSPATWRRRLARNDWRAAELQLIATALRVPLSSLTGEVE